MILLMTLKAVQRKGKDASSHRIDFIVKRKSDEIDIPKVGADL
jgi:hypothetical protein